MNDRTAKSLFDDVEKALDDPANKNKSIDEILTGFTTGEDGKPLPGIFVPEEQTNPNPLLNIPPAGNAQTPGKDTGIKFNFTGVCPNNNNT